MTDNRSATRHTKWGRVILMAVGAAIAVGVVVLAFLWPSVTSSAKDFPLAVTGPAAQVSHIEKALSKSGDTFDITTVNSRADAVSGIRDRTYDGAIVLGGDAPEVLTASASSPVTTQIMSGVQSRLQKQVDSQVIAGINAKIAAMRKAAAGAQAGGGAGTIPTVHVKLTDVVSLADSDPRGAGMAAAAFPFTIGGLIGGIVISLLVSGTARRLTAVSVYAVIVGVIVVSIMQPWLGVLQGSFALNAMAAALAFFATGVFIVGTTSLLGSVGIGVGAVITMLVGNPLSSATAPVQFLPGVWGAVGQWFVPGASATLLRDLSYFPDADSAQSWLALGAWAVCGLLLSLVGHFRNRELVHPDGWDEEDVVSTTETGGGAGTATPVSGRGAPEPATV
ncbi:membrane protein [Humibacter albus]|uniref:membrane protein n=1 Tax=Humibacter albus TaxID=427754 RepID=UPI0003B68913|nr:membrane protein [Humibacter albus]